MSPTKTFLLRTRTETKLKQYYITIKLYRNFIEPLQVGHDIIFFNSKDIIIKSNSSYLYSLDCEIITPQNIKHYINLVQKYQTKFLKVINNELFHNLNTILIKNEGQNDIRIKRGQSIFKVHFFEVLQPEFILTSKQAGPSESTTRSTPGSTRETQCSP